MTVLHISLGEFSDMKAGFLNAWKDAEAGKRAVFFTGQEDPRKRTRNVVDFHDEPDVALLFAVARFLLAAFSKEDSEPKREDEQRRRDRLKAERESAAAAEAAKSAALASAGLIDAACTE